MTATAGGGGGQRREVLRLYRALLKSAYLYPLAGRRDFVMEEVKGQFRRARAESLDAAEVQRRLVLGWERQKTIDVTARSMHWFHSRDQVDKRMLAASREKDDKLRAEAERCNREGPAAVLDTPSVAEFKNEMYNVHPHYFEKVEANPLRHPMDKWLGKGKYEPDYGGKKQRFWVKRYKARFPNAW